MRISDWSSDVCSSDLYARGLDRLDRTLLRACYHDDAIDSRPPLFDGHVEAFLDWVLPVLSALDSSIHLIGNVLIECADDVAAVESYFVATLRARTPHGWTETIRNGRYIDDFRRRNRSEEHTSELQSLMRISYARFCWK